MAAQTLSNADQMYVELASALLGDEPGLLDALTVTFQATSETNRKCKHITIIPKVVASRDPVRTYRCFEILRAAYYAVEHQDELLAAAQEKVASANHAKSIEEHQPR